MLDSSPGPPDSKSVEQLLEEFRALDEKAREIQHKLAAIHQRLAQSGVRQPGPRLPPGDAASN